MFNEIFDCEFGIRAASTSGLGYGETSYYIGNLIYDIDTQYGEFEPENVWSSSAINLPGHNYRHIINNTIYNCDGGINSGSDGTSHIVNNIVSKINQSGGEHVFVESTVTANASDISTVAGNTFPK